MEGGTPYLIAGILVTWVSLAWYTWRLERRVERTRQAVRDWTAGGEA